VELYIYRPSYIKPFSKLYWFAEAKPQANGFPSCCL